MPRRCMAASTAASTDAARPGGSAEMPAVIAGGGPAVGEGEGAGEGEGEGEAAVGPGAGEDTAAGDAVAAGLGASAAVTAPAIIKRMPPRPISLRAPTPTNPGPSASSAG